MPKRCRSAARRSSLSLGERVGVRDRPVLLAHCLSPILCLRFDNPNAFSRRWREQTRRSRIPRVTLTTIRRSQCYSENMKLSCHLLLSIVVVASALTAKAAVVGVLMRDSYYFTP